MTNASRAVLGSIALAASLLSSLVRGEEPSYEFDLELLSSELGVTLTSADVERLTQASLAGHHTYDIVVNGVFMQRLGVDISFTPEGEPRATLPYLAVLVLPLRWETLPAFAKKRPMEKTDSIERDIPGAVVVVDTSAQEIRISIPQVHFKTQRESRIVDRRRWNWGVPMAALQYGVNAAHERRESGSSTSAFSSLSSRIHVGAWRFYARGTAQYDESAHGGSDMRWTWLQGYATRIVPDMTARLPIGELSTSSRFADGLSIRGIALGDDDEQRDARERSYLPVITGTARSAARVVVRQAGRILWRDTVEPGPFRIEQIEGIGYGGDIEVTVEETVGPPQVYMVPFMTAPEQLKTGRFSWDFAAGAYDGVEGSHPWLAAGSLGYGFESGFTAFGSILASGVLQKAGLGLAADVGRAGALTAQVRAARMTPAGKSERESGAELELVWRKTFGLTGTHANVAYERALSGRIATFSDALRKSVTVSGLDTHTRDRTEFSLSQPLGAFGHANLTGLWTRSVSGDAARSLSGSWSLSAKRMLWNVTLQHVSGRGATAETVLSLNVSVPLSVLFGRAYGGGADDALLTLGGTRSKTSQSAMTSLSGAFDEEGTHAYRLQFDAAEGDAAHTQSLQAAYAYTGEHVQGSVGVRRGESYTQFTGAASGGVLLYDDGVIFARSLQGGLAVVKIPDGEGAQLLDFQGGVRSGDRILASGLTNYQLNVLRIDPNSLPPNLTINSLYGRAVPADNGLVRLDFETFLGTELFLDVTRPDGTSAPYGSEVRILTDRAQLPVSVVDEEGWAFISAAPPAGIAEVRWMGEHGEEACYAILDDASADDGSPVLRKRVPCLWIEGEGPEVREWDSEIQ